MSVDERIKPDLRALPDTCGVWHVQGCTARGLDWLATEVPGEQKPAVVVLDEDIADLAREAREAGLVVLVDAPPLEIKPGLPGNSRSAPSPANSAARPL
jgi:hypothetical protein